ncbi:MAG: hypothetical protein MK135_17440 [Polyangiaceae bacterium]|nr:hypothetical protein [Polyangiaceae bacterium]
MKAQEAACDPATEDLDDYTYGVTVGSVIDCSLLDSTATESCNEPISLLETCTGGLIADYAVIQNAAACTNSPTLTEETWFDEFEGQASLANAAPACGGLAACTELITVLLGG